MTKTALFREYASYHADPRNRACHAIGIPLILLGILGALHFVSIGPVDLAVLAAVATIAYYAALEIRGAVLSLVVFAVLYVLAARLPWQADAAAFIAGWIFQLVGHRFEGTKPKFLENLVYLLVGPLFIFEETFDAVLRRPS